ncbi:hypothetical protein [Spirillospora sp. NPDC047279]|uniref:hypothetical protein n=1 Tax=Spirillospora sp. NPDC047279 TaxID=3155478 RepID=UPI0033FD0629
MGAQPGQGPDEGYTDVLYAALKQRDPHLRLVKLGCGGETTTTMLNGGICGTIPLNVARICTWAYQCGHGDGHATPAGYRRIGAAFQAVLTS